MFERVVKKASECLHTVAAVGLAVMFVGVMVDVIQRTLGIGLMGIQEFIEMLDVWVCYLAIPFLLRARKHIRVDLVTSHLSPERQRHLRLVTDIVSAIACLVILWWSIGWISNSYSLGRQTMLLGMYYWVWQIGFSVGILFFALEAIFEVIALVKKGNPPSLADLGNTPTSQTPLNHGDSFEKIVEEKM